MDAKSSLKSSVLSTGNQLLRLKKVDTAGLHSGLAQTDSQWTELLTRIPVVLDKLHQVQRYTTDSEPHSVLTPSVTRAVRFFDTFGYHG